MFLIAGVVGDVLFHTYYTTTSSLMLLYTMYVCMFDVPMLWQTFPGVLAANTRMTQHTMEIVC